MDMNASEVMSLSITNPNEENLYDYVENTIVPELEKISTIAEVSARGGKEEYIKVELIPEKMSQYGVTMSSIASDIAASDVAYPAGDTDVGSQELSVTTSLKASTKDSLKTIPLTTTKSSGAVVYLIQQKRKPAVFPDITGKKLCLSPLANSRVLLPWRYPRQ